MNLWTVHLTRTLHTTLNAKTKEEAEKIAWDDALREGFMTEEEIEDSQWKVEATEGVALSWSED